MMTDVEPVVAKSRFNRLRWWQWLLILAAAIIDFLITGARDAEMPLAANDGEAAQRGGALIGAIVGPLIIPYLVALMVGFVAGRSRQVFLITLWILVGMFFLASLGQLARH